MKPFLSFNPSYVIFQKSSLKKPPRKGSEKECIAKEVFQYRDPNGYFAGKKKRFYVKELQVYARNRICTEAL